MFYCKISTVTTTAYSFLKIVFQMLPISFILIHLQTAARVFYKSDDRLLALGQT